MNDYYFTNLKNLLLISILVLSGYTRAASGITYSGNTTPYTAMDLCNPDTVNQVTVHHTGYGTTLQYQHFNLTGSPFCIGGTTKLYYSFTSKADYPAGTATPFIVAAAGVNISYKFYGPFNDYQTGRDQISNGSATPLQTSAFSTAPLSCTAEVLAGKVYFIEVICQACVNTISLETSDKITTCGIVNPCSTCIGMFQPRSKDFVISAWIQESGASNSKTLFSDSKITVISDATNFDFFPSGQIIDGWQRIEGIFQAGAIGSIKVQLVATGAADVYFDDIRIFPFDGSMMSYVYDPVTLRLSAELDERNYAKFYEYDEEGKLTRVKKETEKGIMTIQENRENSSLEE